jgi:hypothetical protein
VGARVIGSSYFVTRKGSWTVHDDNQAIDSRHGLELRKRAPMSAKPV